MESIVHIDWRAVFLPTSSLAEVFLRGSLIYLFLFFVLRFFRREAGALGITDLLVIVLIADAAQNAMATDYKSVTEGIVLVGTIMGWDWLLDWLGYRYAPIQRLLRPRPVLLIKDGQLQRRNLREQLITREELMGLLREEGVAELTEVRRCYLEANGRLSVITDEKKQQSGNDQREFVH